MGRMVSKYDPAFLMTMLDAIANHHDNTYLCFNFLRLNGKINQEELKDLVVKALAGHGDDLRLQREALSAAEQNKIIEAIPNIVSNFIQRETKISDEAREVVAYLEKFV
ncbi:MAG: hypothetical protein MUF87_17470 [Anaerolineae bacterium]|nr:hypothetical protein [Anaerolineae bacterium]